MMSVVYRRPHRLPRQGRRALRLAVAVTLASLLGYLIGTASW
jgi:hypothetical protein